MEEKIQFNELPISEDSLQAVQAMGFVYASPIQAQSIPVILQGNDVIGQAQTGTGKTASFGIPIIEMIDEDDKATQSLILCPTRELALQVTEEIKKLSQFKSGIRVTTVYGGDPIDKQIKKLKSGSNIVVGTPGRVIDLINRKVLKLDQVKMAVLDEADEMLAMGFIEDITSILSLMPEEKQTILFSATMPKEILNLTKRFQKNPVLVKVVKNEITNENIQQLYFNVKSSAKIEVTSRIIDFYGLNLILIFCNQKARVDELTEALINKGYNAEGLHGDLRQNQRNIVMNRFRNGQVNILVATDVAARGLDVDNVDGVINYDVPLDSEYYVHRIGRTGRAGKKGIAFSLVTYPDISRMNDIMRYTKVKIEKADIPSFKDIINVKKELFVNNIKNQIESNFDNGQFIDVVETLKSNGYSSDQIIATMTKMLMGVKDNEFLDDNQLGFDPGQSRKFRDSARDSRDSRGGRDRDRGGRDRDRDRGRDRDRDRGRRGEGRGNGPRSDKSGKPYTNEGMVKLFINIGFNQKISPSNIVGAIAGETGIPGAALGHIQIEDKHTYVDIPKEYKSQVLDKMIGAHIKGKRVNVELAKTK